MPCLLLPGPANRCSALGLQKSSCRLRRDSWGRSIEDEAGHAAAAAAAAGAAQKIHLDLPADCAHKHS
jgi:hypothetical protein